MVELTRRHERLTPKALPGIVVTVAGPGGKPVELYVPPDAPRSDSLKIVVHFHGAAWLVHQAVHVLDSSTVAVAVNLGAGSGTYDQAYSDPGAFDSLLDAVAQAVADVRARSSAVPRTLPHRTVALVGYSAGHGAVRAILRDPRLSAMVHAVLLVDGLHTSYVPERTVMADGGALDTTNLVAIAEFARRAMRGTKRMLITHSEIFPGTFASTTETTDWLVRALQVQRTPVLRWGPRGMQQLSEVHVGNLMLAGYAGNSAPDHVDQLHALPELLAQLLRQ